MLLVTPLHTYTSYHHHQAPFSHHVNSLESLHTK
jgi:hypothetical protein